MRIEIRNLTTNHAVPVHSSHYYCCQTAKRIAIAQNERNIVYTDTHEKHISNKSYGLAESIHWCTVLRAVRRMFIRNGQWDEH